MENLHPNIVFEMYKKWEISLKEYKEKTSWYFKPSIDDQIRFQQILANSKNFNTINKRSYDWCNTYDCF